MKRSELKQLVKEVIEEQSNLGNANNDIASLRLDDLSKSATEMSNRIKEGSLDIDERTLDRLLGICADFNNFLAG